MEQEPAYQAKIMVEYQQAVKPLLVYLPWLEEHVGDTGYVTYDQQGIAERSLSFPVYDASLMHFVREAEKSSLMDRNYRYVYTRNHIGSHEEERALIQQATWRNWDLLKGILSRYVMGGRVKASLWSEAVKEDVFHQILLKMKEIVEGWEETKERN